MALLIIIMITDVITETIDKSMLKLNLIMLTQ